MSEMFNVHKTPEITNELSSGEFETIFNINIWSRYDDDRELGEMLWFCKYVDKAGLTSYIEELFYDSKADICSIKLIKLEEEDIAESYEVEAIRVIAQLTIDQFEINGFVGHKTHIYPTYLRL